MTTRVEDCPSSSLRVSMGARETFPFPDPFTIIIIYGATAFDSAQLAHLPFMELFSSGEFPYVVAREGVRHARFRLMSDVAVVRRPTPSKQTLHC